MNAVEKYLPVLQRAVDGYEKHHPHWRIEVLVSLIKWSLRSLKHYIEDVRDTQITWAAPLVELHYPVEWNWQPRGDGEIAPSGHIFGSITKQNTATKAAATKTLTRLMANWLNGTALADLTHWAWYEKLNDYYTPVLPLELKAQLDGNKRKRARREAFEEMVRPFSIGASRIDLSGVKPGARIPKKVLQQSGRMDIPGMRFTGEVNGRQVDMGLVFEIQPLLADYDHKQAYHAITVGLAVLNGNARLVDGELVQDTPAQWPKRDRKEFWEGLLREVDKLTEQLIPQPEAQQSVILSVNSTLKIPAEHWRPENRQSVIKQVADAFALVGEVDGLRVKPTGDYYSCFISYSHQDKVFARRLYRRLRRRNVPCTMDDEFLPGDDLHESIERAIRHWDKVLLCASKSSLSEKWWVDTEINRAFQKEAKIMKERGKKVLALIPLNLDGFLFSTSYQSGKKAEITSRVAANFVGWENDHALFDRELEKVIRALRMDDGGRELPPRVTI